MLPGECYLFYCIVPSVMFGGRGFMLCCLCMAFLFISVALCLKSYIYIYTVYTPATKCSQIKVNGLEESVCLLKACLNEMVFKLYKTVTGIFSALILSAEEKGGPCV